MVEMPLPVAGGCSTAKRNHPPVKETGAKKEGCHPATFFSHYEGSGLFVAFVGFLQLFFQVGQHVEVAKGGLFEGVVGGY
ncbi:MAG: hypothetical protein IJ990_05740 [Alistipes sp.]|nr:hypothetical protein [Alistipes sp.]